MPNPQINDDGQLHLAGRHAGRVHRTTALIGALMAMAGGLGGLALSVANSGDQFARQLQTALKSGPAQSAGADGAIVATSASLAPPISGTESFWLDGAKSAAPIRPAAWTGGPAPGDRFQIGGGREQRVLQVVEVRHLAGNGGAGGVHTTDGASDTAGMLLITLSDVAAPESAPVRLLVDADAPIAGLTPLARAPQRNL